MLQCYGVSCAQLCCVTRHFETASPLPRLEGRHECVIYWKLHSHCRPAAFCFALRQSPAAVWHEQQQQHGHKALSVVSRGDRSRPYDEETQAYSGLQEPGSCTSLISKKTHADSCSS